MGGLTINPQPVTPYRPEQFDPAKGIQQAQQIQGSQLQLQQQQQAAKDQQAATKAMQEWDPKQPDQLPMLLIKHKASYQMVQKAQQQALDASLKLSQKAKDDAETGSKNIETMIKQHDVLGGMLNTVTDGASLLAVAQQAKGQGLIDDQHIQQAQQIAALPPDKIQQALEPYKKSLQAASVQAEQALKKAQDARAAAESMAKLPGMQAKSLQEQLTLAGTGPTGITADQQAQLANQQRGQNITLRGQNMTNARELERMNQQKTEPGTWSIQEDEKGKPVMFNNKTGEVKAAPEQIAKPGTYQKQMGGAEESVQYAKDYLDGKNFTGPGDEALMEKFFDVAKPSTGFRMTQAQMDMLNHARSAYQGIVARGQHLLNPNSPYFDTTQREHIVQTMNDILAAKKKVHGGGDNSGGHSFTLNGKQYSGVPDEIYQKYKGQPGFSE